LLQTKGFHLSTNAGYTKNLREEKEFMNYGASFEFAFPIFKNLVLSVTNGAATVDGEPEFYQLNNIGGNSLRGYRRERYWGHTTFHNNNQLQLLFDVKNGFFKGKLGLVSFYDQGRVWLKGEDSDTWHNGFGGGFVIAPLDKAYISFMLGLSEDDTRVHVNFRRALK
jgi:hemolysin activation/secretion protein